MITTLFLVFFFPYAKTSPEGEKVMFPTLDGDKVLLWVKWIVIGLAVALPIAFRFLPTSICWWIAILLPLELALFLHLGFGSTFDQFISTVIFLVCFGFAILAIYFWPATFPYFALFYWASYALTKAADKATSIKAPPQKY